MSARAEITGKYAMAFKAASKAQKTVLLDQVCEVTGWSRDHARRRLSQAAKPKRVKARKTKARKYSYLSTTGENWTLLTRWLLLVVAT